MSLVAVALLSGCATPEKQIPLTGNIMVDGPLMITNGPPQDKALWQYRTAAAAMRLGQFDYAKELFGDALLSAGGVGEDRSAKLARSYFHPEATKNFIGEPYERVMAYYYRGILYWMDGEPDNARACFRSAAIQDTDVESREYDADYVLLDYLDGLASTRLSADGADAFARAEKEARLAKPPPYDPHANLLVFLEFGPGPDKFAAGEYRQELRFRALPSPVHSATLDLNGQKSEVGAYDDLYFQATTRGGRVMDHILANKAVFKKTTDVAGTAAIVGGSIALSQHDRTSQQVGIGLLAAGVLSKIISASTTPQADVRSWGNLPRYLSFAALSAPPGEQTLTVEFRDAGGTVLPNFTKVFNLNIPSDGKDKVVFVSDRSITPQSL